MPGVPGDVGAGVVRVSPYFKKATIPASVRREVAIRAGAIPGKEVRIFCAYCGEPGWASWVWLKEDGTPTSWVALTLELDHVIAEFRGGPTTADNIVLACRPCNRRKGHR